MPMSTQIKLLRVLEDGEIMRVGSNDPIRVDVRLISATNRDLNAAIAEKAFREDLYFRLKVVTLALPPLRERAEDIALLADYFMKEFSRQHGKTITALSPAALQALQAYTWPGNVREMENVMERAATLAEGNIIQVEDLPPQIGAGKTQTGWEFQEPPHLSPQGIDLAKHISEIELHLIREALKLAGGVKSKAAALLGIKRTTLVEKLRRAARSTG